MVQRPPGTARCRVVLRPIRPCNLVHRIIDALSAMMEFLNCNENENSAMRVTYLYLGQSLSCFAQSNRNDNSSAG
jgi:hypothetical protein